MKRILSFVMALCLLVVLVPVPAHAADIVAKGSWNGGNTKFELTSDGTLTLTGTRHIQSSNNPDNYPWRAYKDQVTKIVVAGEITTICKEAFTGMTNVTSVEIGDSVVKIETEAFRGCTSLTSITIPASVTEIGDGVFWECANLPTVTFAADSKLTTLGGSVFGCSGITSQEIPAGVKVLPGSAFYECKNLQNITLPEGLEEIGAYAFYYCENLKTLTLPSTLTEIGSDAFSQCLGLEHLKLYNDITIAYRFPQSSKLSTVTVLGNPESVSGFCDLENLTNVVLPDSVQYIGYDAFNGCTSLDTLDWPESITAIGEGAFVDTGFTTLTIPDTVTEIGTNAFGRSNLVSFTMPTGVQSVSKRMFQNSTQLTTVELGNVTSIEEEAFMGCSALSTIVWSDQLEHIGMRAFRDCKELNDVIIPASVKSIGFEAFGSIDSLEITFLGDAPAFETGCFFLSSGVAYYPSGNDTWTDEVMQNCNGDITWIAVEQTEVLLGDVTGDGKVTAADYSRLLAHVKKVNLITDEATLKAADVTGDGKVTAADYSRLLAHVKKVSPLW